MGRKLLICSFWSVLLITIGLSIFYFVNIPYVNGSVVVDSAREISSETVLQDNSLDSEQNKALRVDFENVVLHDSGTSHVVPMTNGVIHSVKAGDGMLNLNLVGDVDEVAVSIYDTTNGEIVEEYSKSVKAGKVLVPLIIPGENKEYYFVIKAFYGELEVFEYEFLAQVVVEGEFALSVNGVEIASDDVSKDYLKYNGYFSGLSYERVELGKSYVSKVGSLELGINGYQVGGLNYAFDLIACNEKEGFCVYRINGVVVKVEKGDGFSLDDKYQVSVKSITFDSCTERFCDTYDIYDEVEFVVEERGGEE